MAVTATHLVTAHDGVARTSYTTASITPSANKLILAFISNRAASGNTFTEPTLSGNGLTWVKVTGVTVSLAGRGGTLFRAMGASPSAGAVTIDFAGVSQDRCTWSINEFGNVDLTGTNGSGAIVQSATNKTEVDPNAGLTVTLAAFGSVDNATYGAVRSGEVITAGSGFTELAESLGEPVQTEWKATNDTSVDWSWASNAGNAWGVAVEIKFADPAPATSAGTPWLGKYWG